ncbi:MAG: right-handed parallel beta-helix repeat-containing protein [Candidatus Melainabacteria bacterium]|nr:right-handed parallel beta-helix repeat-containing protein [Candidatus Melainabacteria bacterium]
MRKIVTLILLLIWNTSLSSWAQEEKKLKNISGEINEDQIWSGNIHVTGDIWVNRGVTLTILPGTVIKVSAFSDDQHGGKDHPHDPPFPNDPDRIETKSTQIIIDGSLNAIGTPDKRIVFTSDSENPTTYDWDGLLISRGKLKYAIIEYARYNNIQESSNVVIANSIIRNALECCLCIGHAKPVSPRILNNEIYNCGHEGIDYAGGSALIEGNYFHLENPEIQPNPTIGRNGIIVYKNAYPIIKKNTFKKLVDAILFLNDALNEEKKRSKVIVRDNKIEENDVGIEMEPGFPSGVVIIKNNQLINNKEDKIIRRL